MKEIFKAIHHYKGHNKKMQILNILYEKKKKTEYFLGNLMMFIVQLLEQGLIAMQLIFEKEEYFQFCALRTLAGI